MTSHRILGAVGAAALSAVVLAGCVAKTDVAASEALTRQLDRDRLRGLGDRCDQRHPRVRRDQRGRRCDGVLSARRGRTAHRRRGREHRTGRFTHTHRGRSAGRVLHRLQARHDRRGGRALRLHRLWRRGRDRRAGCRAEAAGRRPLRRVRQGPGLAARPARWSSSSPTTSPVRTMPHALRSPRCALTTSASSPWPRRSATSTRASTTARWTPSPRDSTGRASTASRRTSGCLRRMRSTPTARRPAWQDWAPSTTEERAAFGDQLHRRRLRALRLRALR